MRIMILSGTPFSTNNSFGNSYENIFKDIPDIEIADVCCAHANELSPLVVKYYEISERSLLNNLKNPSIPAGRAIDVNSLSGTDGRLLKPEAVKFVKKRRWQIFFWARDLIWAFGRWKSKELMNFIDEFNPDLIFQPVYYSSYLNDIVNFIKDYSGVPMLGYVSDDTYTLRQFSISPLYWIDRLYKRRKVKRTIEKCEILYVISDIQKQEYEKIFTPPCKVLTKCADFSVPPKLKESYNTPLQIVFTGNIGTNRWKSLAIIAKALQELNKDGVKAELRIYTATIITDEMKKALSIDGSSYLMGTVPSSEIPRIQAEADMLVHVEALDLKNRLIVRQSLSTKVVDYFKAARPILAVGPKDIASIDHLIKNDCAIVVDNVEELVAMLSDCIENPSRLQKLAENAYECGRHHHDSAKIKKMLYTDLNNTVADSK